ncbi:MAG: hypothetical protein DRI39_06035 [Chloroflexi bacterium]|nr:MAG: hypothetical protein DRI39_06035 [Chloroflexota bacterium]RLC95870.1 MAG: hypothetical protein DRI40_04715 [Chloroflexota bacterium]
MTYVYAHLSRDEHVGPEGDRYSATEQTLLYRGRTVLYQYVDAVGVTFCTATGAPYTGGINVKGYVVKWKYDTNENGEPLSEIEPITDPQQQAEISQLLWPGPGAHRVNFW